MRPPLGAETLPVEGWRMGQNEETTMSKRRQLNQSLNRVAEMSRALNLTAKELLSHAVPLGTPDFWVVPMDQETIEIAIKFVTEAGETLRAAQNTINQVALKEFYTPKKEDL